ncbi:PAS domain-containing protein [Roseivirga sp. BDSF3-8]|uniref:PAS domain-containing protein n=1 Tax=Roseivirga sp. BDSF3-8 TaxID=3241598 RepID=UPI0035319F11
MIGTDKGSQKKINDLILSIDWSGNPLGPMEDWPASLKDSLDTVLSAGLPMGMLCGPELIQLYNHPFSKLIGDKHPQAMGKPCRESWAHLWPRLSHELDAVMTKGEAAIVEDIYISSQPHKSLSGHYFTLHLSPIKNNGQVSGVLMVCQEQTARLSKQEDEVIDKLHEVFMDLPAFIAILKGPDHRLELFNDSYTQLVGKNRDIIGKPIEEALPEVKSQGFIGLLDNVYKTGKPFIGNEIPVNLDRTVNGDLDKVYVNFIYHPYRDETGDVQGIFVHGMDVTELVKAKHRAEKLALKLRQQSRIFDIALSSIPEYVYVFDSHGRFEYANASLLNLWGKTLPEVIGKNFQELGYSEELVKLHSSQIAEVVRTKRPLKGENAYTNAEGKEGYYEYTFSPILNEDNEVDIIVGSTHDITIRKEAEEILKEQEAYYRSMTNNTPVITWISDAEGQVSFFNKPWYDYTGQAPNTALGHDWLRSIHPEDADKALKTFLKSSHERSSFSLEFRIKGGDGNYRFFQNSAQPKFDGAGHFEGFIGSLVDIHERKLVEQTLRYQNSLLDAQQEVSPLATLIVSPEGTIVNYNDLFFKMWNMPESVVQSGLDDNALEAAMMQLVEADGFVSKVHEVYESRSTNNEKLHFKDGRTLERFGSPIWDKEDGTYYGYVWFFQDITEQEDLARQKDDFIAIASHELKTPVTSIKAYTQILRAMFRDTGDEVSDAMFVKVDQYINKLTDLVTEMLDVTKIEQGQLRFRMETFDLNALVTEIVEDLRRTTEQHTLELVIKGGLALCGDQDRIGQVIVNFLTNAIKYAPESDRIIVRTELKGENVIFSVQDFGTGLSEEDRQKVFDRFYRASNKSHQAKPGMGLGLFICAGIIERHGGQIWVDSVEGEGSTFYFSVPVGPNLNSLP